jgi:hypothetical protein
MITPQQKRILKWTAWALLAMLVVVILNGVWFALAKQIPDNLIWLASGIYWLTYLGPMAILAAAAAGWRPRWNVLYVIIFYLVGLATGAIWQIAMSAGNYYFLGVLVYHTTTGWWSSVLPMFEAPDLYVSSLVMFVVARAVLKLSVAPAPTVPAQTTPPVPAVPAPEVKKPILPV